MRIAPAVICLGVALLLQPSAPGRVLGADSCENVVQLLNTNLNPKIDEPELVTVLRCLNTTQNTKLPPKFVTKQQARKAGWRPGKDLWAYGMLKGKKERKDFKVTYQ